MSASNPAGIAAVPYTDQDKVSHSALQRPRKSLSRGPRKVDGGVEIERIPAKVTWMDKLDGLVDRKLHQKMYEGSKRGVKRGPT